MAEPRQTGDELGELAEQEMAEKRDEMGSEAQARELYDVPTQSAAGLVEEQHDDLQP